jgi:beta-glucuronidase
MLKALRSLLAGGEGRGEPAGTMVQKVDGVPVLFQYGAPVPSFDTWHDRQEPRQYVDLDGTWAFCFDPEDQGERDSWMDPGYDDSGWSKVEVPLPWDLYETPGFGSYDGSHWGEGSAFQDGVAWYRRTFTVPESWAGGEARCCLLGAGYAVTVYLNGRVLGRHEGGNTPFALEAGPALRLGEENLLALRVYRRPWYDSYTAAKPTPITADHEIPARPVDYWPYAGVTRSLYLECTSPVNVVKVLVAPGSQGLAGGPGSADTQGLAGGPGSLVARVVVSNHGDQPASCTCVIDPGEGTGGQPASAAVDIPAGDVRVVEMEVQVPEARWWSPGDPACYRGLVELRAQGQGGEVVHDRLPVPYGLRSVTVGRERLVINGEPVFLKGANWHEETAERGRSLRPEDYAEVIEQARSVGANALRNSHYNRHPSFYEQADRQGLLVLDEADNFGLNPTQEQLQRSRYGLSRALVQAMVWNQANHPSVIAWSVHNESSVNDKQVYRAWVSDLVQSAKALDLQRRPVTWASWTSWDPAFDLADVVAFNEYFGIQYGQDSDLGRTLDTVHRSYPKKPILLTENGTWASLGWHGDASRRGTEEWQDSKLVAHWAQIRERPYVAGYFHWLLRDYKERKNYNQQHNGISMMGLLTLDGRPKRAAETFRQAGL